MAAVAYILTWITGLIIFLVAEKDDKYTRYHALQAIGFGVAAALIFIVLGILVYVSAAAEAVALVGLFGALQWILWILVIVAIVVMAVKAYQGKKFRLPLIANMAEKNA